MKQFNSLLRISIILFFASTVGLRAQEINFIGVPDWVSEVRLAENSPITKFDVNNGVYTSLLDNQVNFTNDNEFFHFATRVMNYGGVTNASELYLTYDSSYQTLDFHYLYVIRNGKKIDKTSSLSFETLTNESNLQSSMYSGKITAYDILEDIRKDDIVEYAYTIKGENPIFEDYKFKMIGIQGDNPMDKLFVKFVIDQDEELEINCLLCDSLSIDTIVKNGLREIVIQDENILAVDYEESAPPSVIQGGLINVSNFKNWKEVEQWAIRVFKLPNEPNLDEVFDEIFTENMKAEEKIDAIINYVQDEIRYMGVESGIGSHQPFPPEQVVKQRFGDCKDKALLAKVLLNKIGITEAYPVLVSSYLTKGLDQFLPAGQLFDHVILYFEYEGNARWIDLTISQQGYSFEKTVCPDYGDAIIIGKENFRLTDMNIKDTISRSEVLEEVDVSSFTEKGSLTVTTKMYGLRADYMRSALEYYSINEVSNSMRESYSNLFPKIEILEDLKISDNLEDNVITTVEHYSIEDVWKEEIENSVRKRTFQYEPLIMYNYVSFLDCEKKKFKVSIPTPSWIKQNVIINYPDEIKIDDKETVYDNEGFYFKKKVKLKDKNQLDFQYEFKTKVEEISAEDYVQLCDDMNKLVTDLPSQIYYNNFVFNSSFDITDNKKKKKKKKSKEIEEFMKNIQIIDSTNKAVEKQEASVVEKVFYTAEKMPVFKGGLDSLMQYISKNIQYPSLEKSNQMEGTVYCKFVVNKEGKVVEPEILKSESGSLNFNLEAIRLLNDMPNWEPGKKNGEAASIVLTIPIHFSLQ